MNSISGFLAFALATSSAVVADAGQDLVCYNMTQKLETTVAVKKISNNSYVMTVYKTIAGHAVTPHSEMATQLHGSRGSVLAFGNREQTLTLVLNLSRRNSAGKIVGTYTNSIQKEILEVTCK